VNTGSYDVHQAWADVIFQIGVDHEDVDVFRRFNDQRYNLGETGLLKEFAVYPHTNKITVRQSSASDDVIRVLKDNVDDLDLEGYYFEGMDWIHDTTFQIY
jgi:hypothetical protein